MIARLRGRQEWQFFRELRRAAPAYAIGWWVLVVLRGTLPAVTSIAFGWLVSAITRDVSLSAPLAMVGASFSLLLIAQPLHQVVSSNLGGRMAAHLYDRLMATCVTPAGIGHLERSELTTDLTMARDFDLGMMGPPLDISMDFIAGGLVDLVVGISAAILLAGFHWWAALLLIVAWGSTHWLLRESGVWKDRNTEEVRTAQRHADYSYRLAVDAAPAKELRFFGLAGWVTDRFVGARRRLYDLQYQATRLREKSVAGCLLIVLAANGIVFWLLADGAANATLTTARVVVFVQAAIGVSSIAFGGLNWALDGAAAPVAALARVEAAVGAGTLTPGRQDVRPGAKQIRFRAVSFAYEDGGRPVLDGFDLTIPAGSSMAIVGQNGAGKTTLAKLLCRLYDTSSGTIEIDGQPLESLELAAWRSQVAAVFQDFIHFELPLRNNVAPSGAPDDVIRAALAAAGGADLAGGDLDTILSKGYPGGTDLSGGQWQRVALARALCAVQQGAGVVLLDEPTAQLDVRGEAEIFERVLEATRECTTILISHRFSTVRLADRICVVEDGKVVELGTHDELMAHGGRYRTMFDLQASRFSEHAEPEYDEQGEEVKYETLR
ncbi:MAG TPA: ABC transporter ATP-binding protein [Ilumatobacteraceae bacterium]|nr:ABC transporter ATP-binding protein [Ilumatobacteraceae bacterium]